MNDFFPVIGPQVSVHQPPFGCLTKRGSEQLRNLGIALVFSLIVNMSISKSNIYQQDFSKVHFYHTK